MADGFNIQVQREHYNKNYDDLPRFISYFHQIESVINTKSKTVLEVGIGNKTVTNYLMQFGFDVTTCDFDGELDPDEVADVRELPFIDDQFDLVLCCEVLEHIPFEDVPRALSELKRVSKRYVIISIPYSTFFTEVVFTVNLPYFSKRLHLKLCAPFYIRKYEATGEHKWEMGRKNYSRGFIRRALKEQFDIKSEFQPMLNPNHYFFILEKC